MARRRRARHRETWRSKSGIAFETISARVTFDHWIIHEKTVCLPRSRGCHPTDVKPRPCREKDLTDCSDPTRFPILHTGRRQSLHQKTRTRDPYSRLNACHSCLGVRNGICLYILRIAEYSRKKVASTKLVLVHSLSRWMQKTVGLLHDSKRKKGIARLPILTNKIMRLNRV